MSIDGGVSSFIGDGIIVGVVRAGERRSGPGRSVSRSMFCFCAIEISGVLQRTAAAKEA